MPIYTNINLYSLPCVNVASKNSSFVVGIYFLLTWLLLFLVQPFVQIACLSFHAQKLITQCLKILCKKTSN